MKSNWISIDEKKPFSNGKYWVYPYHTIDGHKMVTMLNYENGEWDHTFRSQSISFWKPIDVPKPPKIPRNRD